MRTLFDFELHNHPSVSIDARARQRNIGEAAFTDVKVVPSYANALKFANEYSPDAIVKEDGSCLLFGAGGSGLIWVCTAEGEISESQDEMVSLIMTHLSWLGAVKQTLQPFPRFDS